LYKSSVQNAATILGFEEETQSKLTLQENNGAKLEGAYMLNEKIKLKYNISKKGVEWQRVNEE